MKGKTNKIKIKTAKCKNTKKQEKSSLIKNEKERKERKVKRKIETKLNSVK